MRPSGRLAIFDSETRLFNGFRRHLRFALVTCVSRGRSPSPLVGEGRDGGSR